MQRSHSVCCKLTKLLLTVLEKSFIFILLVVFRDRLYFSECHRQASSGEKKVFSAFIIPVSVRNSLLSVCGKFSITDERMKKKF